MPLYAVLIHVMNGGTNLYSKCLVIVFRFLIIFIFFIYIKIGPTHAFVRQLNKIKQFVDRK